MDRMREALRNLLGDIHWRALAAVWILSLIAAGVLAAVDASVVISSMVLGAAAATFAMTIVGGAFVSGRSVSRSEESEAIAPAAPKTPHSEVR